MAMDRLKELMQQPDNRVCADCAAPNPQWASTTIGVFLCIKCCGVHRSLGEHISTVVSVTREEWTDEQIEVMEAVGGNASANAVYEKCIPSDTRKPPPDASIEERSDFIRRKYEDQEFLKPNLRMKTIPRARSHPVGEGDNPPAPSSRESMTSSRASMATSSGSMASSRDSMTNNYGSITSSRESLNSSRDSMTSNTSSTGRQRGNPPGSFSSYHSASLAPSRGSGASLSTTTSSSKAGNDEVLGSLKVKIVRGRNLVVRDLLSSDPYVAVTLRTQSVKTKVVNRNLNPVWNEEFLLSVSSSTQLLKLEVFDHDVFSADDSMGEAVVDLNPLILAAQMHEGMFEEFGCEQIGRWLASSDNALVEDSNIEVIDGLIKQDMILKLQNVDRGVLDVSLEWVPVVGI